jgi:hypothetical protein
LPRGLSAFREMFKGEPAQVLRAIGYFEDGDVKTLRSQDRKILCDARDRVNQLPDLRLRHGSLAGN